ncbi:Glycoside hydrolase 2 (Mannanase, beta-galactosidase) [Sporothrix bragantina]|uniref:Glycoside hydrolase 2 (Mannanase, beta-galactosidase) n=1 Tax=Sporothrix bragantina TaxID=671064 RepID=A0ABP0BW74_9PEZI
MEEEPTYHVQFIDGASSFEFTSTSSILRPDDYHPSSAPHIVSAAVAEVYGNPDAPVTIRIGNGGLGPTGLLQALCSAYISQRCQPPQSDKGESGASDLKFEWVCNHSRHTQAALQAGVVDVALTYEREEEDRAEKEGWSRRVGVLCHDHFVLAGPNSDPAGLRRLRQKRAVTNASNAKGTRTLSPSVAFKVIADTRSPFHTRGDGSATMHREQSLWSAAGVSPGESPHDGGDGGWYKRLPCTPLEALRAADAEGAYLLTDRATVLLAYHTGEVRNLDVFVEGAEELLSPCSILLRSDEKRNEVMDFVKWLGGQDAQTVVEQYGRGWEAGIPLFTPISQAEVAPGDEFAHQQREKHGRPGASFHRSRL